MIVITVIVEVVISMNQNWSKSESSLMSIEFDRELIIDRGDDPRPAEAIILEARVNGTPLTALCGYTWVPSRDPQKYPVCPKCAEIFEFARDFRGI